MDRTSVLLYIFRVPYVFFSKKACDKGEADETRCFGSFFLHPWAHLGHLGLQWFSLGGWLVGGCFGLILFGMHVPWFLGCFRIPVFCVSCLWSLAGFGGVASWLALLVWLHVFTSISGLLWGHLVFLHLWLLGLNSSTNACLTDVNTQEICLLGVHSNPCWQPMGSHMLSFTARDSYPGKWSGRPCTRPPDHLKLRPGIYPFLCDTL